MEAPVDHMMSHGTTSKTQRSTFTDSYNLSSSVHAFAAIRASVFAIRNPALPIMGLEAGACQVVTMKGMEAIPPADTDMTSAHRGPLVCQSTMQTTVRMATTVSRPVHP